MKVKVDNKKLMAYFICILMVLSVAGFIGVGGGLNGSGATGASVSENTDSYNGYQFYNSGYSWQLIFDGRYIPFTYHPEELKEISFDLDINHILLAGKIYVIDDAADSIESAEQITFLQGLIYELRKVGQDACIKEEGCGDVPIVSCDTITAGILLQSGIEQKAYIKDACVVLEGKDLDELTQLSDRLSYTMLGVMT